MLRGEVLILDRHPGVAVAEHRHHRPLRDAGHRERRRGVVSQIVEVQILDPEPLHEVAERPGSGAGSQGVREELADVGILCALMRSDLSPAGAHYTVRRTVALTGGRPGPEPPDPR